MMVNIDAPALKKIIKESHTTAVDIEKNIGVNRKGIYCGPPVRRVNLLTALKISYFMGIELHEFVIPSEEMDLLKQMMDGYDASYQRKG